MSGHGEIAKKERHEIGGYREGGSTRRAVNVSLKKVTLFGLRNQDLSVNLSIRLTCMHNRESLVLTFMPCNTTPEHPNLQPLHLESRRILFRHGASIRTVLGTPLKVLMLALLSVIRPADPCLVLASHRNPWTLLLTDPIS